MQTWARGVRTYAGKRLDNEKRQWIMVLNFKQSPIVFEDHGKRVTESFDHI